jgi:hypothetical protein
VCDVEGEGKKVSDNPRFLTGATLDLRNVGSTANKLYMWGAEGSEPSNIQSEIHGVGAAC